MPCLKSCLATALLAALVLPPSFLAASDLSGEPAGVLSGPVLYDRQSGEPVALGTPASDGSLGAFLAAQSAVIRQDLTNAGRFLLRAQADDPEDETLLGLTFTVSAAGGLLPEARALAPAVIKVNPREGSALLVLAAGAALEGNWAEARQYTARLASDGVAGALRGMMAAWASLEDLGLEPALDALQVLQRQQGLRVLVALHQGLLADIAGDTQAARAAYAAAVEASPDLDRSLRLALLVGNFRMRDGDQAGAIRLYEDFLAKGPGLGAVESALEQARAGVVPAPLVSSARSGLAEVLFQVASILVQETLLDAALIQVNLALELNPALDAARMLLGEILLRQGRLTDAIAAYRAVPADALHAWAAGLGLGDTLAMDGQVDEAVATYEQMAAQRPGEFEPFFYQGNTLRSQRRFVEAAAAYDRAVERVAAPTRRHWTLFYFRGVANERIGNWDQAEADFLKALELEPEQPQVMNYLAYSWVEQKVNLEQAREMLTRAVALRRQDGFITDSLGWLLYRLGEYEEAVAYLERAVELEPGEAVINDHLGDAYWQVGRKREARVQWQRALSFAPADDLDEALVREKIDGGLPASEPLSPAPHAPEPLSSDPPPANP